MFSRPLGLETELVEKLHKVVFFTALYVPAWLSASQTVDAPVNDLLLLKRLLQYRKVDSQIAEAALPVIRRHLWYLQPPTVVLVLFGGRVEDAVKQEMTEELVTSRARSFPA